MQDYYAHGQDVSSSDDDVIENYVIRADTQNVMDEVNGV
jgi:hypothetical protein